MIIYEVVNKENGKVYVGLTTKTLEQRKRAHLNSAKRGSTSYFHKAIRKYGEDAFEWDVSMYGFTSFENLAKMEQLCISLYEPCQTYNISIGGEFPALGMKHTDETKAICREHAKRRWDGKRATDKYPEWLFHMSSYRKASKFGVPKTTWYRTRKELGLTADSNCRSGISE